MSTCPDKILYSVYIDEELLPKQKEILEAHLSECTKCRKIVESYKKIKQEISTEQSFNLNLEESFFRLEAKRKSSKKEKKIASWFYKSVRIPVPLVAAAALTVFVFTPLFLINQNRKNIYNREVVVYNFKPIIPVSKNFKKTKQLNLNDPNILKLDSQGLNASKQNRKLNLETYINLYMPIEKRENHNDDFIEINLETNNINTMFVKNE